MRKPSGLVFLIATLLVSGALARVAHAEDTVSPEAAAEAKSIFESRCTVCHGLTGKGDGSASAGLTPPPRNLTAPEWQASVTDAYIEQIIKYGGAAVGKSAAMPPNPDLMAKEEVIKALRAYVRGLAAK